MNLADYKDEYREGLQRIIDAKIAGEEIVAPTVEAPPKVVNLMDALEEEPGRGQQHEEEAGEGRRPPSPRRWRNENAPDGTPIQSGTMRKSSQCSSTVWT